MGLQDLDNLIEQTAPPSRFRTTLHAVADTDPDAYAKEATEGKRLGVPAQLLPKSAGDRRRLQMQLDPSLPALPQTAPKTAAFLEDPENAKVAMDDHPALSGIEKWFNRFKSSVGTGVDMLAFPVASLIDKARGDDKYKEVLSQRIQKFQDMAQESAPDVSAGFGERLFNAVTDLAPYLVMGPAGVPILAGSATAEKGVNLSEQGVQGGTLSGLSALSGLTAYGMTKLPFGGKAYGKGIANTAKEYGAAAAKGAVVNLPLGIAGRAAEKGVLNATGYDEQSGRVKVLDSDSIATDVAMGMIFGGLARYHQAKAEANAGHIQEMVDAAQESKLRTRMSDTFKSFVKEAAKDGEIEHIGMPVEKFEEFYQSTGKPLDQLLTDPSTYYEAKATGGDVVIPVEDFMAHMAEHVTPEHIMDMRLRPGDDTLREAQEAAANEDKAVEDFKRSAEQSDKEGALKSGEQKVYDDIFGQLLSINTPRDVAEKQAALWAIRARTRADRLGKDAWDLYSERPVEIVRGGSPDGGVPGEAVTHNQELLQQAIETPEFKEWFGKSVLVDAEGKPLVAYHGSGFDVTQFDIGKAGSGGGSSKEKALFFSTDKNTANHYAEVIGSGIEDGTADNGGVVYPVHLKLENPYVSKMKGYNSAEMTREIKRAKAKGHDGIVFPDMHPGLSGGEKDTVAVFAPEQVKSLFNRGTYDPNDPNILHQSGDDKRAFIRIGETKIQIGLLEKADLSSFLHETGHGFLEELKRDALREDAPEQIKADWETLKRELGIEGDEISTEAHEKFAGGFEKYLADGKAPSAELMPLFARFKAWVTQVYRKLKGFGDVKLSDEVRGVMDRLLATDDEIARAEEIQNLKPLFATPEEAGMTAAEFEPYRKVAEKAHEENKNRLLRKMMDEISREQKAWWREEKAKVGEEVTAEAQAEPVYQAFQFLAKGESWDGVPVEYPLRLDREALVRMYGEDFVKTLPRSFRRIYAKEGGVHPDIVAEMFGFSSGDEMIRKLAEAPKMESYVKAETERRMLERHGAMLEDGSAAEEALKAIHSDETGQLLRAELRAIHKMERMTKPYRKAMEEKAKQEKKEREYQERWMEAEKNLAVAIERGVAEEEKQKLKDKMAGLKEEMRQLKKDAEATARWMDAERNRETADARNTKRATRPLEFYKAMAADHINGLSLRAIKAIVYARAEAKAGREAYEAALKKDYKAAGEAQERRLINHYLYIEAVKAQERIEEKVLPYMRKMDGKTRQGEIGKAGGEYLEQIQAILSRYQFSKVPYSALDAQRSLQEYLDKWKEAYPEHEIPVDARIIDERRQANYREVPVNELFAAYDAVRAIEHAAKLVTRALKDGKAVMEEDARGELVDRLTETHGELHNLVTDPQLLNRFQKGLRQARKLNAEMTRIEFLIERLDGGTEGPWHDYFWNGYLNAEIHKNELLDLVHEPLKQLVDEMPKEQAERLADRTPIFIKSMGESFSRQRLFSILMNLGNESNRDKLMRGGIMQGEGNREFSEDAIAEIMTHFTKADFDLAQGLWETVGKLLPEAQALHKRWTGLELPVVEPTVLHTPYGDYAGGYWPVKFDSRGSEAGKKQDLDAAIRTVQDLFGFSSNRPKTAKGYTHERTEAAYPLMLDWKQIATRHINDVTKDLAYREWLDSANRLLKNGEIKRQLQVRGGEFSHDIMEKWLRGTVGADSWGVPSGSAADEIYKAGYSHFTTAVLGLNIAGAFADIAAQQGGAFTRVGPKYMLGAYADFALSPKKLAEFVEEKSTWRRHIEKQVDQSIQNSLDYLAAHPGKWNNFMRMTLSMRVWMYKITGNIAWKGAYEEALDQGHEEAEAVRIADKVQRMTEHAGDIGSISAMERHPVWKKLLVYAGPVEVAYNAMMNNLIEIKDKKGLAPEAWGKFFTMWMAQSVVWAAVRGKKEDDESWGGFIARHAALGPFEAFPILRDLVPYAEKKMVGKHAQVRGLAITSPFQATIDAASSIYKAATGEGEKSKAVKDTNIAAGMVLGYPSLQLDVTGQYLYDVLSGQYTPKHPWSPITDALWRRHKEH